MAEPADLGGQPPQNGVFDDPPTGYNSEQLYPDMTQVFPDDGHIHWKDESEEQHQARLEATSRRPPNHKRYYSQEGNKPAVRSGSVASDRSDTASHSNDDLIFQTDVNSKDLDQIDAGRLFVDSKPEVANKLADRRGRDGPAELDFTSRRDEGTSSRRRATRGTLSPEVSSATFRRDILRRVSDPNDKSELLDHFKKVNDLKNKLAFDLNELYKQKNEDYENVMNDYYAGAGEERRRARVEAELEAKERRRRRKEEKIQRALDRELRDAESDWNVDPETGVPVSLDSDNEHFSDGMGEGEEEDGRYSGNTNEKAQREFYSDEEDEWPGDASSRRPVSASTNTSHELGTSRSHRTHSSTYSLDKPLPATPAIPPKETQQTMISIDILLRLLPIKIALVEQTDLAHPDPKAIYAICERANKVCSYAGQTNAAWALQGRCAFYMGLAEYMRSRVDGDNDQIYALVIEYFENAFKLCGDTYQEGEWGEEWARWLRREKGWFVGSPHPAARGPSSVEVEDREEGGLVDKTIRLMKNGMKTSWDRLMGRQAGKPEPEQKVLGRASDVLSYGAKAHTGSGPEWLRPEDIIKAGGVAEKASHQSGKPVDLAVDTKAVPKNSTVFTPPVGIQFSPEKYANGIDKPPAVSSGHSPKAGLMYAMDSAVSPHTKRRQAAPAAPAAPVRRYHIANPDPDPPSRDTSGDSKEASPPVPVTNASPAVSPGSGGIMTALGRRLSSTFSPTSDTPTTGTKPAFDVEIPEKPGEEAGEEREDVEETEKEDENGKRLSIAARRRQSASVAALARFIRGKAPERSDNTLKEAEEGNSPSYQTSFDLEGASPSGTAKKSPLSPEGGEEKSGRRRRRSAGRTSEEMV